MTTIPKKIDRNESEFSYMTVYFFAAAIMYHYRFIG